MIKIYSAQQQGKQWLATYKGQKPIFACILGFTATGLIPGISAAGATPADREYTAIADAEFLINGCQSQPQYPLPPLSLGISPVIITHAIAKALDIPIYLFNAGLHHNPNVSNIDLGGLPAQCLTTGQALPLATVEHLYQQGLQWGQKLAQEAAPGYLILGECVVGGTTTALALLTGLGIDAAGKVNSSHPHCNHQQKWQLVQQGLTQAGLFNQLQSVNPYQLVAAVGDPMQITVAAMAIAASRDTGVILAGGTQMLAVYALLQNIAKFQQIDLNLEQIVVGTTRWVAEDPTGDTVGLAHAIAPVSLLATQLNFSQSQYPQLRAYEQGYVKEGVGAGGIAIAASLYQNYHQTQLLATIENLVTLIATDREITTAS